MQGIRKGEFMGFSKFFLNAGEALRPVLTKIIPMKLLSKMKAGIINNATDKLSADSIAAGKI